MFLGTKSPGNESSSKRKVQGTKVPENERARERKFLNESSRERKVSGTKVPHRDYSFFETKGLGHEKSRYPGATSVLNKNRNFTIQWKSKCGLVKTVTVTPFPTRKTQFDACYNYFQLLTKNYYYICRFLINRKYKNIWWKNRYWLKMIREAQAFKFNSILN